MIICFCLRNELDRNRDRLSVITNNLSGNIRSEFEYLFETHGSVKPVS